MSHLVHVVQMILFRCIWALGLWWSHSEGGLILLLSHALQMLVSYILLEALHLCKSPQIDLKGLPRFLMTQVLQKYPMSIQCIQRAFSSRQSPQRSLTPPSPSLPSTQDQPFTASTQPYEEDLSLGAFMGRVNKQKAPDVDPK